MPTNDERREVAEGLRELAQALARGCDDRIYERVCGALIGSRTALVDEVDDHIALVRLADLIEPEERTCRMRDTSWDDGQCTWGCICSECGARHEHNRGKWLNYCPNCGARVEEGE